jgi:alpha-mannosidase
MTEPAPSALRVTPESLENDLVRARLGPDGTLESVYDKRARCEVLAGRGNQLWAYVDKPGAWDAWNLDADYTDAAEEVVASGPMSVVEQGPHRASVRIERRFRHSCIVQDVRLWANSSRIDFKTHVEWGDRRYLLKARFPLAVRATHALFETAFGVVSRPTYRNTSWDTAQFEVPGHRFALLAEPRYGVALLNDSKYGHHAVRNELGLSLLRSPVYPDPRADEGFHEMTYSLFAYEGDWLQAGVLMEAEDLNRPLFAEVVVADAERSLAPLTFDGLQLGLAALKPLEEGGGLVLRLYEPQGARGAVRVGVPEGWRLDSELNLLEEPVGEPQFYFTPFQVRSWRLRRA